jgi:putative RNA 2'-phosphotransferase
VKKKLIRTSKFLSLILRHKPQTIGLSTDAHGWVSIQALLDAANIYNHPISRELLDEVVFTNDKKRFSYSPDGRMIRANQGHSLDVDLDLEPIQPPVTLYHGTVDRFLISIQASGLQKMNRQHVHLSATVETAQSVGSRRGKPVVLSIYAEKMYRDGHRFLLSLNGVWLTDLVPWKYIKLFSAF